MARTTILHLSDLHLGPGEAEDVAWKSFPKLAERQARHKRLKEFLNSLDPPDYMVVSGDVAIAGHEDGFKIFVDMIGDLIKSGHAPPESRILVVPGNHDVTRLRAQDAEDQTDRWRYFFRHVANRFARPWFVDDDASIDDLRKALLSQLGAQGGLLGGATETPNGLRVNLPFLLDLKSQLLVYAWNSASISGTHLRLPDEIQDSVRSLRKSDAATDPAIARVLDAFDREIEVDPARIQPSELELFRVLTYVLRDALEEGPFNRLLKVAVLHHHVAPIFLEEVKKFELLLNAGQFKRELREVGFDLILHGHKHSSETFLDTEHFEQPSLVVVSGGTIGGELPTGERPGFNWIEYDGDQHQLSIRFVPLKQTGMPKSIFGDALLRPIALPVASRLLVAPAPDPLRLSLQDVYKRTGYRLLEYLRRQTIAQRQRIGWSQHLENRTVSTVASAYGLAIIELIHAQHEQLTCVIPGVIQTLWDLRLEDRCWKASSQKGGKGTIEATTLVLGALSRCVPRSVPQGSVDALEELIGREDDGYNNRVYSLATAIRVLSSLRPSSQVLPRLVDALHRGALEYAEGYPVCWSQECRTEATATDPQRVLRSSVVHTAHAALALGRASQATGGGIGVACSGLSEVASWLLSQDAWCNDHEEILRPLAGGDQDTLTVKHYTDTWVVRALLELGIDPREPKLVDAVRRIYASCDNGLWSWGSLAFPIWATHDALDALTEFSLRACEV